MGREIELKLTIERADVERFVHHSFISRYLAGQVIQKRLVSLYYDTHDLMLRGHHTALRVRWDGNRYIQTLKYKGRSRNGLTDREEWEWPLEGPGLNTALVPMNFWPAVVRTRLDTLTPLFETNFERTLWPLEFPPGSFPKTRSAAKIELVLDQGEIRVAVDRCVSTDEILEVELELMEGDSDILHLIWEQLAGEIRLEPSDVSKAERGYRLFAGQV